MPFSKPLFRQMTDSQNKEGAQAPQKNKWSPAAADASDYIAQMTAELAIMAKGAQLELLAYFLEMAQMEAEAQSRAHKPDLIDITPEEVK